METILQPNQLPFGVEKISDIFKGKRIYYSGSIRGVVPDPLIGYELVTYMLANGAEVPSAHVAARTVEERAAIFEMMSGRDGNTGEGLTPEIAYEVDMNWVDSSTHVVALVDSPSFGVGMEVMRGLIKGKQVLCLVSEENLKNLSFMIRGAGFEFGDNIQVSKYSSTENAKEIVNKFLLKESNES